MIFKDFAAIMIGKLRLEVLTFPKTFYIFQFRGISSKRPKRVFFASRNAFDNREKRQIKLDPL